ncbi:sensor histidine kinase [Rhodococcus sp. JS3073]|uniref:sensor histidine kinase n=1 Tax=Rhodococcus sp. JS3073 TaxID=3002901 RepID=UPI0022861A65|nr:GAF domain-containing protein [Rhodococcus sp. JS3073]WAM14910.1 GAF domain-containing protein [Rhodococcus sp. JS3073]
MSQQSSNKAHEKITELSWEPTFADRHINNGVWGPRDDEAALRRVATLVARGFTPTEVFSAVAEELARVPGVDNTGLFRYEPDSSAILVANRTESGVTKVPVGTRLSLEDEHVAAMVLRTGRAARINTDENAAGSIAAHMSNLGIRSAVGAPIAVDGCLWGAAVVGSTRTEPLPPDTEARIADFTDLVATAIANAQTRAELTASSARIAAADARAEQELRELAEIQAALRRLAMLVARGEPPEAVFAAATREALRHFGGGTARMIRYELDGTATLLANEGTTGPHVRVGERWEDYPPTGLTATVLSTGRAARVDDYGDIPGGEPYLREGLRSAVAMPIHVNGRLWGAIAVGSGQGPLPPDTEHRMTEFTDLVATAVANAQTLGALEASRDELARLLDEQAALRRVATLVARGIHPVEIFLAVAEEVRRLLGADSAGIARFEPDGASVVVVGGVGEVPVTLPTGTRVKLRDYVAPAVVWRTGRSALVNENLWSNASGRIAEGLRGLGIRSMVASPIIVEGRMWGVVNAVSTRGPFPSDTADRMADFTELAGTAVGNAEGRAEVAASRTRIVAAADEARRRIERDLHDGAQQHLLALALRLRSAATAPHESNEIRTEITNVAAGLTDVIEELREISRGIHPAILSSAGLRPALRALGRRSTIPVHMDVRIDGRLPEQVEVGAYYVVSEMLTNATKHARASVVEVDAEASGGTLRVRVRDDGVGGADPQRGSGLVGLKDRIEALGGTFSLHSPPGGGTTVSCDLPGHGRRRSAGCGP